MLSPNAVLNNFREGELWFRTLADSAPVLIWSSDSTGLCTYFNRRWLQFTGRTLEESLGEGWVSDVHVDDRERVLKEYTQAFQNREQFRLEYRLKQCCQGYKWIVDFGAPVFRSDGTFLGYIGSCIDVAEMHEAKPRAVWRQKYEAALADAESGNLPERIAAAEIAIRDQLELTSNPDEQASLMEPLAQVLALKKNKLGFME
jgi:PAS domain S-box-containing protein